jgi:hypothetical protein
VHEPAVEGLLTCNGEDINIIRQMKSKRMRWAGHVACMGDERGVYRVLEGKPKDKETALKTAVWTGGRHQNGP